MIAIVHSIHVYSQSVHVPALNAGLMDNDAERYCTIKKLEISYNNALRNLGLIEQVQCL